MKKILVSSAIVVSIAVLTGCTPGTIPSAATGGTNSAVTSGPLATVDSHVHPTEGPHHGSLVELGNEEYHVELVLDDKSVTIYILDAAAKNAVPIDSPDLTINVMHEGKPEQFKLPATPDTGDPAGKSSRFTLADEELAGHIDDEAAGPRLSVTINGTPYRGEIKHSHDHAGHSHD